jgi:hypothetical protein
MSADTNQNIKVETLGTGALQLVGANGIQVSGELNAITGDIQVGDHIDMNSSLIKELATPVAGTDAANKNYVDSAAASAVTGGTNAISGTTGTFSSNVSISGNLTVQGTTTTVNSETISLADNIIDLNSNMTSGTPTENAGLRILRGDSSAVQIRWNETSDKWEFTNDGTTYKALDDLGNNDTDELAEGSTNLYYTDARVDARLASGSLTAIDTGNFTVSSTGATFDVDMSFSNGTTNVFVIDASTGNTTIGGTTVISGGTTINNTFDVSNDVTFSGDNLFTIENSSSTSVFAVDVTNNSTTIATALNVNNNIAITEGDLSITNSSSTNVFDVDVTANTFDVSMDVTLNNATTINNDLTINNSSATNVFDVDVTNSTFDVTLDATFNNSVNVANDFSITNSSSTNVFDVDVTASTFNIALDATFNNTVNVKNDFSITNSSSSTVVDIDVTANTYAIDMDLTVNNATVVNNNLTVNNTTATTAIFDIDVANTTVDIDASLTVSNNVTFDNDITFNIDNSSSVTVFSVNGSTGATTIGGALTASSDVTISGNLTVSGTTTTVNTETINLADNIILLNSNATGTASQNGGIEIERGDDVNVQFLWDETNDRWSVASEDLYTGGAFIGNLTGDVTGTVSSLSNHDTDDLLEGTSNLYWTTARGNANFATNLAASDTDDLSEGATNLYYTTARWDAKMAAADTDDLGEGATNLYYTDTRVRSAISASGDLSYNSTTGAFSFTERTDAEVRGLVSVTDAGGDGSLSYNSTTGVITYTGPSASEVRAHFSAGTGITVTNGVIATTITQYTDSDARGAISVTDAGGDGSLAYNSTTGVITYTGPSAAEVRAHFSGGTGIAISNGAISVDFTEFNTGSITEGSNLYFTNERVDDRVAGLLVAGTGISLSYNDTAGTLTVANTQTEDYVSSAAFNTSTGVLTLTRLGGGTVTADLDGRYMNASNAFTYSHSSVQTVNATVATNNGTGAVTFDFNELEGAVHYTVYLNRQLLRPGEFSVDTASTTANLTISTGILAEDDELEVVTMKVANQS